MLKRFTTLALPFALVLSVGLADGRAEGIKPAGPAPVEAPPDASKAGEVKAPADAPSQAEGEAKKQEGVKAENPQTGGNPDMKPLDLVAKVEKGQLKNPYKDYPSVAQAGHKKYMAAGCNGCHGGGGGGGMCPPLTNDVWVYGGDDDTLFRLISLGSEGLGMQRKGRENVKGPMPPHGEIVKTQDDMWKIISWIRTVYKYDAKGTPWEPK